VKRRDLIRKIGQQAKARGLAWEAVRAGAEHDIYRLGVAAQVSIPRHNEINEITARKILQTTESELGEGWWK
jgi:mRNA interferase HicA